MSREEKIRSGIRNWVEDNAFSFVRPSKDNWPEGVESREEATECVVDEIVEEIPEEAYKRNKYIKIIDEYPIPFDREEIVKMQEDVVGEPYGLRPEDEIIETVDGFHERYIEEMVRTDEWSVFNNGWNDPNNIYFWNHQLGYGFKVDSGWETMCGFVDMMDAFTDEYSSEDFEPAHYMWEIP
jgi:hypothetical protein